MGSDGITEVPIPDAALDPRQSLQPFGRLLNFQLFSFPFVCMISHFSTWPRIVPVKTNAMDHVDRASH